MVVLLTRFELVSYLQQRIFLLLHVAMTAFALQSGVHLDHTTIVTQVRAVYSLHIPSFDISSAIVSKRFPPNLTRFTLVISSQVLKPRFIETKVRSVCRFHHSSIEIEYLIFNHSLDLLSSPRQLVVKNKVFNSQSSIDYIIKTVYISNKKPKLIYFIYFAVTVFLMLLL